MFENEKKTIIDVLPHVELLQRKPHLPVQVHVCVCVCVCVCVSNTGVHVSVRGINVNYSVIIVLEGINSRISVCVISLTFGKQEVYAGFMLLCGDVLAL